MGKCPGRSDFWPSCILDHPSFFGFPQNYNRGDGIMQGNDFFDQLFLIEAMDLVQGDETFLNQLLSVSLHLIETLE